MNYLFYFLCACPSLLNPFGVLPLWILLSFYLLYNKRINLKYPSILGIVSSAFILFVIIAFLGNTSESKFGHLLAYILFFAYAIPFFISYFSQATDTTQVLLLVRKFALVSFLSIEATLLFDYILLNFNINYANFIPSDSNIPVIANLLSRPRGFYPEPTEASMALNSFFLLFTASNYSLGSHMPIKDVSRSYDCQMLIAIYISSLLILRSASGIISLITALVGAFALCNLFSVKSFSFSLKFQKKYFALLALWISLFITFLVWSFSYLFELVSGLYLKITLNPIDSSAFNRKSGFIENFSYFLHASDPWSFFIGFGPGHASYLTESNVLQRGSTSWFLDLLTGFGIIGVSVYLFLLLYIVFVISPRMIFPFRFWYLAALFAIHIHLFTNTSFYFPVLPFILALPFVHTLRQKSR